MIRFIRLLFESPEVLTGLLRYIPHIAVLVFTMYIAMYVKKRYSGTEATQMIVGAVLQIVSTVFSYLFSTVIIPSMADFDYSNITIYYTAINLIGTVGAFFFLFGAFNLIKKLLAKKSTTEGNSKEDLNSFIERL